MGPPPANGGPTAPNGCPCGGIPISTLAGLPSSGLGLEHLVSTSVPGLPSNLGDDMLYKLSRGLNLSRPIPPDCKPPAPCLVSPAPCDRTCGSMPCGAALVTPAGSVSPPCGGCASAGGCAGGCGGGCAGGCGGGCGGSCGGGCGGNYGGCCKPSTVSAKSGGFNMHYHPNPSCLDWLTPMVGCAVNAAKAFSGAGKE